MKITVYVLSHGITALITLAEMAMKRVCHLIFNRSSLSFETAFKWLLQLSIESRQAFFKSLSMFAVGYTCPSLR